jgi:hypothetical protein
LKQHLRSEIGGEWWRNPKTGDLLRDLFREGTKPTSEEIAGRIGFDSLDMQPLLHDLQA